MHNSHLGCAKAPSKVTQVSQPVQEQYKALHDSTLRKMHPDPSGIYFYFPGLVLRWRQEDADNNTQFLLHPLKSILDIL